MDVTEGNKVFSQFLLFRCHSSQFFFSVSKLTVSSFSVL